MVCVHITRDPKVIGDALVVKIRDSFHRAVVKVIKVNEEDVELRVRDCGRFDVNTAALAVDIDCGPGKDNWRIEVCRTLLEEISESVMADKVVEIGPDGSNVWLRVFVKGASMPLGHPDRIH
jgi:hypothetical protein